MVCAETKRVFSGIVRKSFFFYIDQAREKNGCGERSRWGERKRFLHETAGEWFYTAQDAEIECCRPGRQIAVYV